MVTTIVGEKPKYKLQCSCGSYKFTKMTDNVVNLYKQGNTLIFMNCYPDKRKEFKNYYCVKCKKELILD